MNSTPLKVLQANVARSQKAQHEFIRHFMESDHKVALLCEPYIGRGPEVHNIVSLDIYQFTTNGRPVKACVLIKQEVEGRPRGDPVLNPEPCGRPGEGRPAALHVRFNLHRTGRRRVPHVGRPQQTTIRQQRDAHHHRRRRQRLSPRVGVLGSGRPRGCAVSNGGIIPTGRPQYGRSSNIRDHPGRSPPLIDCGRLDGIGQRPTPHQGMARKG